jgi:hypothetical protein
LQHIFPKARAAGPREQDIRPARPEDAQDLREHCFSANTLAEVQEREEVYRRLSFIEWGRLARGLVEPWGERRVYDSVHFYMPLQTK